MSLTPENGESSDSEAEAVIEALEAYENEGLDGFASELSGQGQGCDQEWSQTSGEEVAQVRPGRLYMVAVPIGNRLDFTKRALAVLGQVNYVACEEVQATKRLFLSCHLQAKFISYRESGREAAAGGILDLLGQGQSVAFVSGAGTPGVSDPGRDLAERCWQAGFPVVPVPGASALTAAISVCGLPGRRFVFEGFLPRQGGERRRFLQSLAQEERTMFFYEAPHRVKESLADMLEVFGNRQAFLGRELTKRFEECLKANLSDFVEKYATESPRGEYVIGLTGATPKDEAGPVALDEEDWRLLADMQLSDRDCVKCLVHFRGLAKNEAKRQVMAYRSRH